MATTRDASAREGRRSVGRRFAGDRRGIAAIEFGMLLPLMALIYLGGVDVMRMVRAASKVENAAHTAADLTAQEPTAQASPASDLATIIQAAAIAATPFDDAGLTVTVSAINMATTANNTQCCSATVVWSVTQGGTLRPCKTTLQQIQPGTAWAPNTIPAGIGQQVIVGGPNGSSGPAAPAVIVVDVSYVYTGLSPGISHLTSRTMWRHAYAIPRLNGQVTITSTSGLAAGQSGAVC